MSAPPTLPTLPAFLTLCVAAALAGCASPEPSAPQAADADLGGEAPSGSSFAASASAAAASPPPGTRVEPFTMDGETPAGGCAFVLVAGDCRFLGGDGSSRVLDANGTLLEVRGTLRWTGPLPGSLNVPDPFDLEVLVLHEENGQWTFGPGDPYARGPSPLEFELPLTALDGSGRLALQVSQSVGVPLPVGYVGAMAPHAFHLEGELESAGPAGSGTNPS